MNLTKRGQRLATLATAAVLGTGIVITGSLETAAQRDLRPAPSVTSPVTATTCTTDAQCRTDEASRILGYDAATVSTNWQDLPQEMYPRIFDVMVDPRDVHSDAYCLWAPDDTTVVVCTDGTVVTS